MAVKESGVLLDQSESILKNAEESVDLSREAAVDSRTNSILIRYYFHTSSSKRKKSSLSNLNPNNIGRMTTRDYVRLIHGQARDYMKNKKYRNAMTIFSRFQMNDPEYSRCLYNWATCYYELYLDNVEHVEYLDSAIGKWEEFAQLEDSNLNAHNCIAICEMHKGNYEDAEIKLDSIINMDYLNASYHNNRGVLYQYMNRPENALAEYIKAVILEPGHQIARRNRDLLLLTVWNK